MTTEQREFQAETRQLLDLMVHSIYSNKDSFLRELVSNSSDALDKLRLESYRDKDLDVDVSDLHIEFEIDKQARTLTIRDNGIGMTREEVIDLIGTLAKSGTADGMWALATDGEARGTGRMFFRVPVGAELCGPCFTPDGSTLFLAVQHPGADGTKNFKGFERSSTFADPATRWPDFEPGMPPRPSILAITAKNGGPVGG